MRARRRVAHGAGIVVMNRLGCISRYERTLANAAIGGQQVVIGLRVRRVFCGNPGCPVTTFVEQVVLVDGGG